LQVFFYFLRKFANICNSSLLVSYGYFYQSVSYPSSSIYLHYIYKVKIDNFSTKNFHMLMVYIYGCVSSFCFAVACDV